MGAVEFMKNFKKQTDFTYHETTKLKNKIVNYIASKLTNSQQ